MGNLRWWMRRPEKEGSLRGPGQFTSRLMVPSAGLEPAWVTPYAPQTYVSTNSTTTASRTDPEPRRYLPEGFAGAAGAGAAGAAAAGAAFAGAGFAGAGTFEVAADFAGTFDMTDPPLCRSRIV